MDAQGLLTWTNGPANAICSVEASANLGRFWMPGSNVFASNTFGKIRASVGETNCFYRLRMVDVSGTPEGFTNLVQSYGMLETIAGTGAGQTDGINYWNAFYEGEPSWAAALSRPHYAQADRAGNIYIVDKNSHSILKVTPDGVIRTFAGTHERGFNGDGPELATDLQLDSPNGAWVRADGTVYMLDTNNGRVRRVDTEGRMQTLFQATSDGSALPGGRGLWVSDDETLAYFCAGTRLRKWTPSEGVKTVANDFVELGTIFVEANGDILVCDRGANLLYRITPSGKRSILAGNGDTTGGGDGFPALETGLEGLRSVWPLPNGALLLLTHDGCQFWYMDTAGIVRLLLNGAPGRTHGGDGQFFYSPEAKISEGRSVTVDYEGNILITESDWGYVRRIRFQRIIPD